MYIKYSDLNSNDDTSKKAMHIWVTYEGAGPQPRAALVVGADFVHYEHKNDKGKLQDKGMERLFWDEPNMSLCLVRQSSYTKYEITREYKLLDGETLLVTVKGEKMSDNPSIGAPPRTSECSMMLKFKGSNCPSMSNYILGTDNLVT